MSTINEIHFAYALDYPRKQLSQKGSAVLSDEAREAHDRSTIMRYRRPPESSDCNVSAVLTV